MRVLSEKPPLGHLTTFGGHPVSCAAGFAALRLMQEQGLPDRAKRMGTLLDERLQGIVDQGLANQVWGRGLLFGLDVGRADRAQRAMRSAFDAGLLLGDSLHAPQVLKLTPPLIVDEGAVDEATEILASVLGAL